MGGHPNGVICNDGRYMYKQYIGHSNACSSSLPSASISTLGTATAAVTTTRPWTKHFRRPHITVRRHMDQLRLQEQDTIYYLNTGDGSPFLGKLQEGIIN